MLTTIINFFRPKPIILYLKAKHFQYADYTDNKNCPIAKAAKEQFNTDRVEETVNFLKVKNKVYVHDEYRTNLFQEDKRKAEGLKFDNDLVVRMLELKKFK